MITTEKANVHQVLAATASNALRIAKLFPEVLFDSTQSNKIQAPSRFIKSISNPSPASHNLSLTNCVKRLTDLSQRDLILDSSAQTEFLLTDTKSHISQGEGSNEISFGTIPLSGSPADTMKWSLARLLRALDFFNQSTDIDDVNDTRFRAMERTIGLYNSDGLGKGFSDLKSSITTMIVKLVATLRQLTGGGEIIEEFQTMVKNTPEIKSKPALLKLLAQPES